MGHSDSLRMAAETPVTVVQTEAFRVARAWKLGGREGGGWVPRCLLFLWLQRLGFLSKFGCQTKTMVKAVWTVHSREREKEREAETNCPELL